MSIKASDLVGGGAGRGEVTFAIPGTYTWTCPEGVTSVSVVCVGATASSRAISTTNFQAAGGGELRYKNNITVEPGTDYTVTVGAPGELSGENGGASSFESDCVANGSNGRTGGSGGTGDGGGNGGSGSYGGGGAGGYSGNGGAAYFNGDGNAGAGGGGGAGYGLQYGPRYGGGGVGLFGEGSNGAGGTTSTPAGGGSGGQPAPDGTRSNMRDGACAGGIFGGGPASPDYWNSQINTIRGTPGAVRIVWPGDTRQFPSTDVGPS